VQSVADHRTPKHSYTVRDSTSALAWRGSILGRDIFRDSADLAYYSFAGRRVFCRKKASLEEIVVGSGFVRGSQSVDDFEVGEQGF